MKTLELSIAVNDGLQYWSCTVPGGIPVNHVAVPKQSFIRLDGETVDEVAKKAVIQLIAIISQTEPDMVESLTRLANKLDK